MEESTTTASTPQGSITNCTSFLKELRSLCKISLPTIIGLILYKIPWMISLHFVGALGPEPLAAAALATTLCNVTGLSFSVGLSSAISTLTGQAKGHLLKEGHRKNDEDGGDSDDCDVDDEEEVSPTPSMTTNITAASSFGQEEEKTKKESSRNPLNVDGGSIKVKEIVAKDEETNENTPLLINNDNESIDNDNESNNEESELPLLPLVFLFRGLFIQLLIVVPIGLWWIEGIEPLLLHLGQAEKLSGLTTTYLRILTPGLWSYSINWTVTTWLQTIEMADVPAYAAFVGFLLHVPFNILYVNILGYGYRGVAMATVSFQLLQPIIIFTYIFGTKHGRDRILTNTGAKAIGREKLTFRSELYAAVFSFSGIKQYLELGLPGMVSISEWWASECCIFLAGTLHPNPDYALGAMSIYQSINTFCFMFPIGFGTAASSRVGMLLGKNQPDQAHLASRISLLFAGLLSVTMGMILFFTPHTFFPSFFTSDQSVIQETSYTITLLAFYVFADGLQCALQGIIKGCGKQFIVAPIVVFSYWVIGVPLAYYNTFIRNDGVMDCEAGYLCGVRGLIFGLLIGTWVHMLLLVAVVIFLINWKKEVLLAQERMMIAGKANNNSTTKKT